MGKNKGYCARSDTREIMISEFVQREPAPFFFDVRNSREEGLVILLNKDYNAQEAQRMCEEHSHGGEVRIKWEAIASVQSYLDWFSRWGNPKYPDRFIDACDDLRRDFREEGLSDRSIFERVGLLEMGRMRGIVDFAHLDSGVLSLYNVVGDERNIKKRKHALERSAGFFNKHFGDILTVVGCFLAFYDGKQFEIDEFVPGVE